MKQVDERFLQLNQIVLETVNFSKISEQYIAHEHQKMNEKLAEQESGYPWSPAFIDEANRQVYDGCAVCNGEEFSFENQRLQCSECENYVHQDCVGEKNAQLKHEMSPDFQLEVVWTCQVCQI